MNIRRFLNSNSAAARSTHILGCYQGRLYGDVHTFRILDTVSAGDFTHILCDEVIVWRLDFQFVHDLDRSVYVRIIQQLQLIRTHPRINTVVAVLKSRFTKLLAILQDNLIANLE